MNNPLITLGITILLVIGLSGCTETMETSDNNNVISISINDLEIYSYKYMNKTVTVKGHIRKFSSGGYELIEKETDSRIWACLKEGLNESIVTGEEYYWTGIVKYGNCGLALNDVYIEVSKTEPA